MNKNERCQALPIIRTQKVEWSKSGNENNVITLSYPKYNDEIRSWIDTFYSLDIVDNNYIENCEKIKQKQISDLTRDETLTRITSIIRGERFCDGTIAKALENGMLEELCVHLHESVKQTEEAANNI